MTKKERDRDVNRSKTATLNSTLAPRLGSARANCARAPRRQAYLEALVDDFDDALEEERRRIQRENQKRRHAASGRRTSTRGRWRSLASSAKRHSEPPGGTRLRP